MTNFINANGFLTPENPSNDLPNSEQVEFCKNILAFVTQRPKFNYDNSSYGYKHTIEKNYDSHYISNGAFLLACQQLGFDIEQDGLNGYLKFTSDDLKLAIIKYYSEKSNLNQNNIKLMTDLFKQSKIKTYQTSFYSLCLFFKQEINATPFEVFTSLNNLGIIMKNKSSVYMEDVNTSNIAWTDQFYIPISKTKLYKLI